MVLLHPVANLHSVNEAAFWWRRTKTSLDKDATDVYMEVFWLLKPLKRKSVENSEFKLGYSELLSS